MDNASYASLTRLSGLNREMQAIAHNIANAATDGFRKEGVIFSEFVRDLDDAPSLSMAAGRVRLTSQLQGGLEVTNGDLDFAIKGEGYFMVETPEGEALTRAGSFLTNAAGEVVTPDGMRLLDAGGAPVVLPPDAGPVSLATDGTLSIGDVPIAQIGLWRPAAPEDVERRSGLLFALNAPAEPMDPLETTILQGHLEQSNVDAIAEVSRMMQVQRAYELGQSLLEKDDQRIRNVISTLSR